MMSSAFGFISRLRGAVAREPQETQDDKPEEKASLLGCAEPSEDGQQEQEQEHEVTPPVLSVETVAGRILHTCRRCRKPFYSPAAVYSDDPKTIKTCGWHHPGKSLLICKVCGAPLIVSS